MAAPNPAFQLLSDLYTGGEYGTSYGTEPYGGGASPPYFIPDPVIPSADLQAAHNYRVAEIRQKRHGVIISNRKVADKRRWPLFWDPIQTADLDNLSIYFLIRKFRLLPFGDPTGYVIVVRWLEQDFKPVSLRGGWWKLNCMLEEI